MKKLMILGAGGHGRVVADCARSMGYQEIAFLDDVAPQQSAECVLGSFHDAERYIDEWDLFVAVGNQALREQIFYQLKQKNAAMPVIVDSSAVVGSNVTLGDGTVIMPGTVINNGTKIGCGCIINTGSTVDHDNVLEDFVHISPGTHLAGTVHVGRRTWLGTGCSVVNNCSIAADCILGAGTVIVRDIDEAGTYVGVPARKIK